MFTGAMTAMITPFRDGKVDESALQSFVEWQIESGIDGIITCGTTGESATVSPEERKRIITVARETSAGRVPIIAGTGSNSTEQAIRLTKDAVTAGADAHLSVTPYYNKPTQEGLYQHFAAIAAAVPLPMILYNVPGRTAVNMLPETVARLAALDHIVGLKESVSDLEQVRKTITMTPKEFSLLSGDDAANVEMYKLGGKGCISVTGNVAPQLVSAIWNQFAEGNGKAADEAQRNLQELNKALFIETNPIPAKTALSMMDRCAEEFRLPMTPLGEEKKAQLRSTLKRYRLLS